jgi:hypothetical protein
MFSYSIQLQVIVRNKKMDESLYSMSGMAQNRTFMYPPPVTLIKAGRRNLTLRWDPPVDRSIMRHFLEYKAVEEVSRQQTIVLHLVDHERKTRAVTC